MTGVEGLVAAWLGGLLTSASPCVLAAVPVAVGFVGGQASSPRRAWSLSLAFVAGMNLAMLAMGLLAARLGLLMGVLPGPWWVVVGAVVMGLAVWLWWSSASTCRITLPVGMQQRLARSGYGGALVLGGLIGTVMSPCAAPALAAALTMAGSGALFGTSVAWGAALLLAYGLGHSVLILLAGAMPSAASSMIVRCSRWEAWLPGRRAFAILMGLAGAWWVSQGLGFALPFN